MTVKVKETLPRLEADLASEKEKVKRELCELCRQRRTYSEFVEFKKQYCPECFIDIELDELLKLSNTVALKRVITAAMGEAGNILQS